MYKILSEQILQCLSAYPDGVAIADIAQDLNQQVRTLQRHMQQLLLVGQVMRIGQGRATRYRLTANQVNATVDNYLPLSPVGEAIRQQISAPLTSRQRTTY